MARSLAVLLAVFLSAAVGCSDSEGDLDSPDADLPDSATRSDARPTSSAKESRPPEMPAVARKDSLAGAQGFVLHYIDLLNYASATGETQPLRLVSSQDCGGCFDYISLYDKVYGRGGYFRRGDWMAQEKLFKQRYKRTIRVVATVDAAPGEYRMHRSAPVRSHGRAQYSLTVVVEHGVQGWKVVEFDGSKT